MKQEIPQEFFIPFQDKHALLWICQRYELLPGKEPHTDKASITEVEAIYRNKLSELDKKIASIFWEAIWTDSVRGLITDAINENNLESKSYELTRLPLLLAADPDQEGQIDHRQHLPIYFLRGLLNTHDAESRFPCQSTLKRLGYQLNTYRKLSDFPDRLLIIMGCENLSDLEMPFEAVSAFAPLDMKILIIWPNNDIPVEKPQNLRNPLFIWNGNPEEFIDYLLTQSVPESNDISNYQIRIRKGIINLTENDLGKIEEYFQILLEKDLIKPNPEKIDRKVFENFINGIENEWIGYAAGLDYSRNYLPTNDVYSLAILVRQELEKLNNSTLETSNLTLTLPAQTGSGVTTLLRHVAFKIACEGYPTLLLNQSQVNVNIDVLAAFLGHLQQKCISEFAINNPPALIIFDSGHENIKETYSIAQTLSTRGRQAVIIRVENISKSNEMHSEEGEKIGLRVHGRHKRLYQLNSEVPSDEITDIHSHFESVALKYPLRLEIPTLGEWLEYQSKQMFTSFDGETDSDTLFWVALHFFLFNRNERTPNEFRNWIWKVYERLQPPIFHEVIQRIAVLSLFKIVTPITPLFRSFGNNKEINYQLFDVFTNSNELNCLLTWEKNSEELGDQGVRFKHPLIAKELIRITKPNDAFPIEIIWPIIECLHAGSQVDIWLAENIAYQILRTQRRSRGERIPFLELRLETYKKIPSLISNSNKAILHHWARALYHGATEIQENALEEKESNLSLGKSNNINDDLLIEAISKIEKAISLPNNPGQGEHPAYLFTTLGTIYFEVYRRRISKKTDIDFNDMGWEKTSDCFKKAIRLIPDNYPTLAAYSFRLLDRASFLNNKNPTESTNLTLEALSLLAQAEDVANEPGELSEDDRYFIITQRKRAYEIITPDKAQGYIDQLIAERNENAFLILAWKSLENVYIDDKLVENQNQSIKKAIQILENAISEIPSPASWRIYHLLYKLQIIHPEFRGDFARHLEILGLLEKTDFKWNLKIRFEYAVLCYQNNRFDEGHRRFRELRALVRQPDQPQKRFVAYLRSQKNICKPRITTLRVLRVDSEWRGYCFIQEMNQEIPFRPRQFEIMPRVGEYRKCIIRFETMGPLAFPDSFSIPEE